ncbi:MAG: serine hydrolase domain-containing protein [Candidatus Hodarchaeales archaeon]
MLKLIKHKKLVLVLFLSIIVNLNLTPSIILAIEYVPTEGWRTSTPEEVGMDAAKLDEINDHVKSLIVRLRIDSVTVIRQGWMVVDEYYDYYSFGNLHTLNCITRTVTNVLIGIANKSGFISNLDEPIVDIFSNRTIANMDEKKESMTIRHLLAMKSGLTWREWPPVTEWPDADDYAFLSNTSNRFDTSWKISPNSYFTPLFMSNDWVQFILDLPMNANPGTRMQYSFADSHLLQAIIHQKTGMSSQTFADNYLFTPLNITDYHWWKDPQGVLWGGGGLWLHPHDIAKIGYLYLNYGTWGEEDIVQKEWVQESVEPKGVDNFGNERGWAWCLEQDYYVYIGAGGQTLLVQPKDELIVVITSSSYLDGSDGFQSELLILNEYIFPALPPSETAGVGPLSLLVAIMFLISWHKRKK